MSPPSRPFLRTYGIAALSGVLLVLSFPTFDLFPLAWVALSPLLVILHQNRIDRRQALLAGYVFGLAFFFGTVYWVYHSINVYGHVPLVPSFLIVVGLCAYLAVYPAVFAVLYAHLIRKTDLPVLIVAPVLWTPLEFARSYALTGFPWSSLGYSQYKLLPLIQVSDITGIYGVSFLVMACNGAVADLFLLKSRQKLRPLYSRLPTAAGFMGLFLVMTCVFGYGFYRLSGEGSGRTIKASIVQGNIEQDVKWDLGYRTSVLDTYQTLSRAASGEEPDLIVWPETALPFVFGREAALTSSFTEFQRRLGSYVLSGTILARERPGGKVLLREGPPAAGHSVPETPHYTNSAVLLDRDGNVSYIYDKIHLVPFGEYVPLRSLLFFVDKLAYGIGDYIPGDSHVKAVTPFGSFGTLICYEIIFPGLVRKFFSQGGDFIVTITNDAWFGTTHGPYQHFSMAVFRAIENRKPVIRAANTGISGFIDSRGRIGRTLPLFMQGVITSKVQTDRTLTVYTKYGDIFSYLCIVSALLLLLLKRKYS